MARAVAAAVLALLPLALTLALTDAEGPPLAKGHDLPVQRNAVDDLFETIREIIRSGSEDLNLPVLDPFQLESIGTSMEEEGAYEVTGSLRNVVVTGLGDFDGDISVTQPIPLLRYRVTVDIVVPVLQILGEYSANGLLGEVVRLYGDGNLKVAITEFRLTCVVEVGVTFSGSLNLRSLDIEIDIGNFEFELDGLLEGGALDGLFSLVVNELAKVVFQGQKENLEQYLVSLLEGPLEDALSEITISDLLCTLLGICSRDDERAAVGDSAVVGDVGIGGTEEKADVVVAVSNDSNVSLVKEAEIQKANRPHVAPEFERVVVHRRS